MVAATFTVSLLFLYMIAIAVLTNLPHAKMFSFGWSNRIIETPGGDDIANMYEANKDTSAARLSEMLETSLRLSGCRPVVFNGGLQWHAEEVSPTCNCVRNSHVEYIGSVVVHGVRLNVTSMNTPDSIRFQKWISNRIKTQCFQNVRHTQVSCSVLSRSYRISLVI